MASLPDIRSNCLTTFHPPPTTPSKIAHPAAHPLPISPPLTDTDPFKMTIKHLGKRCDSCDKTFNLFSSPFTCNACGKLAHAACGKKEFVKDPAKDSLQKTSLCIGCWTEDRSGLINRRLLAG